VGVSRGQECGLVLAGSRALVKVDVGGLLVNSKGLDGGYAVSGAGVLLKVGS